MAKVAVGGFHHETNIFSPHKTGYAAFVARDEWPPLGLGEQMLDNVRGVHLPVSGAIQRLNALGHEIVPLLWCSATPAAHVSEMAFERIAGMMLDALRRYAPVDGVLLDIHGAMVCEHLADGDGELLRRVRACVGDDVPVVACLDLHANISDLMIGQASVLEAYRTYPHVDMGATGERAAEHLDTLMRHRLTRFPGFATRRPDFLIPLNLGCTLTQPCKPVYDALAGQVRGKVAGVSLTCGFPHSDVEEAGPVVLAYGFEQKSADAAADHLLAELQRRKPAFSECLHGVQDGVAEALRLSKQADGPVIIADTQDNPGGGGPGDTTEILRELVAQRARNALVGIISDPRAAQQAHSAGKGSHIRVSLGGKSGFPGSRALDARLRVLGLSDGCFRATGPMLAGSRMDLGPTALLKMDGVLVVVGSKPVQTMDQSMFRHLGVEPRGMKIIALKSSVHFRNDFEEMSAAILPVAAPGPVVANLAELPFQTPRLQRLQQPEKPPRERIPGNH